MAHSPVKGIGREDEGNSLRAQVKTKGIAYTSVKGGEQPANLRSLRETAAGP